MTLPYPVLSPDEAAELVTHGATIGFSGFTSTGSPKEIPLALARKARVEHAAGQEFQIGVVTGASTGASLDGALAEADAISWRTPFQSNPNLRKRINANVVRFFDLHLSSVAQSARYGFLGKFDFAIVEVCDITAEDEVVLTSSVGASPTFLHVADKVILELNSYHPRMLHGLHDIYEPGDPPYRKAIPLERASDRIGSATVKVDPKKILGVVHSHRPDEVQEFKASDPVTRKIGTNLADFLAAELRCGRIPRRFLPLQAGIGNTSNAALAALAEHPDVPDFEMFTEVVQDSCIDMIEAGRLTFASSCSLTLTAPMMERVYRDLAFFRKHLVLRPQEITNHPELIRRLGVISMNTALEVDLFGNVNSTHVMGQSLVNGIGGSGDFTRNAYLSIFMCPSTAKGGAISAIVPLATHIDHNEHSVQIIVTEQGVADLRNTTPYERAHLIVKNCAHPDYREQLLGYFSQIHKGHSPQMLSTAFAMHEHFEHTGSMLGVNWSEYFR